MADTAKVVINLATGLEDAERVTVAFLVGGAALERGKQVTIFLARLVEQYADDGGSLLASHLLQRPQAGPR
jgi:predicted peroxiredoxin